jgi:hypothetical protein
MKMLMGGLFAMLLGLGFAVTPVSASSAPIWNMEGGHLVDTVCRIGCARTYVFTMNIPQVDFKTGNFSGTGWFYPNPSYVWNVSGNVKGDHIAMTILYTRPGVPDVYKFEGTIDKNGVITGTETGLGQEFDWITTLTVNLPTDKNQCKNGGWKTFTTNPIFMNQGDCVSFLESNK